MPLARIGVERALRLLAHLHGVVGRALHIAVPPVVRADLHVLQTATGIRRRAEGEIEREDAHRRLHLAVMGLRRHAVGADERPECRRRSGCQPADGALIDVHLGSRTANADNGNHLSGVANGLREPRCGLRGTHRCGADEHRYRTEQYQESSHQHMLVGDAFDLRGGHAATSSISVVQRRPLRSPTGP